MNPVPFMESDPEDLGSVNDVSFEPDEVHRPTDQIDALERAHPVETWLFQNLLTGDISFLVYCCGLSGLLKLACTVQRPEQNTKSRLR